jgi:hypothetical protein
LAVGYVSTAVIDIPAPVFDLQTWVSIQIIAALLANSCRLERLVWIELIEKLYVESVPLLMVGKGTKSLALADWEPINVPLCNSFREERLKDSPSGTKSSTETAPVGHLIEPDLSHGERAGLGTDNRTAGNTC